MALLESEPLAESVPLIKVEAREVDDFPFAHLGQKATEYWVRRGGSDSDVGLLHWEMTADGTAVSDGFDLEPDCEELTDAEWANLILCMQGLAKARHVTYPGGQQVFMEAL